MQELGLQGEAGGGQKDKTEAPDREKRVCKGRGESTGEAGRGMEGGEAGISRGGARVQVGEEISSGPWSLKRSWSLSGNLVAGWIAGKPAWL